MRKVPLQVFVQGVEARKRAAGITNEMISGARNSGERRTPQKRALLARTRERAIKAGLQPLPARF